MFTGFMVDDSNILKFEAVGNMSSDRKYSVEWWIFKPKGTGEQVMQSSILMSSTFGLYQYALFVLNLGEEANQFSNILGMDEVVLPFEWHSFCISINIGLKQATVFHNGHIQAIQNFKELTDDTEDDLKFMNLGHLGGAKFVGIINEFEAFGSPLPDKELFEWTLCQTKEIT